MSCGPNASVVAKQIIIIVIIIYHLHTQKFDMWLRSTTRSYRSPSTLLLGNPQTANTYLSCSCVQCDSCAVAIRIHLTALPPHCIAKQPVNNNDNNFPVLQSADKVRSELLAAAAN